MEGSDDIHIALVGEGGSGKSSFINSLSRNNNTKLAETSVVTTTSERKCFSHPTNPNIKLWDLPGLGRAAYPTTKSYYDKLDLGGQYHAFLLFTKTRLTIDSQRLALRLEGSGKPFVVIRTFIDVDVDNEKTTKQGLFNEGRIVEDIREDMRGLQHLDSVGGEEIFLISNVRPEKWDFGRLKNSILFELPTRKSAKCSDTKNFGLNFKLAKLSLTEKEENIKVDKDTWLKYFKTSLDARVSNIQENGVEGVQKEIEKELHKWKDVKIRLAIIGDTGCGKSSFINAIRGITDHKDTNAAETGITETTMDTKDYHYPDNPNITLVDCPGVNTENFPDVKMYGKKIKIDTYDAFIIITATRFTKYAGTLALKVKSMNKPFFFVRSKIDQDRQNERRKWHEEFNEVEMLEKIRAECFSILSSKGAAVEDNDIFLISNVYRYQWDFSRLTKAIDCGLPFRKSECFLLSMFILSEDILERKVNALKGKIWLVALFQSCIIKVVSRKKSSRRSDFQLIVEYVEYYRSKLGFPKEDSKEFKEMPSERQDAVRKFFLKPTTEDVESWLGRFDTTRGVENDEKFPSWLSVDKAIEAPYKFVYRALHQVLDEMKEIAIEIVKDATARAQADLDMDID